MTITYFLMLLFVFWLIAELRYALMAHMVVLLGTKFRWWHRLECFVFAVLGTLFFHNVW